MVIKKKSYKNWEYCIYLGKDELARKRYKRKSGFVTKKSCIEAAQLLQNKSLNVRGKTFSEIGEMYLKHKASIGLRPSTIDHYKSLYNCIKREFKPYINPIKSITVCDINQYIYFSNSIRKSNSTRKIIFIIKGIFNFAKEKSYISKNIFDHIPPISEIRPIQKIWNLTELNEYIPILEKFKYFNIILLALDTGLRLGEILALTWDNVDLIKGIIYVNKSYVKSNGNYHFSSPKTESSIRQIVLLNKSIKLLSSLYPNRKSKYIFYDSENTNKPLNPHTVTTYFRNYMHINNIRHIRFHDLRHIHASLLLHHNINHKLLAKRLGHTNVAFTLQTYAHILSDNEIQLYKSLPDLF